VTERLDRRTFIRRGALGAAGVAFLGSPLLAACSSDKKTTTAASGSSGASSAAASFGSMDFQCSWIKNVEFAGEYIADTNGYYKDAGFSTVNLITGGPGINQDSVVDSGKAFIGTSDPTITAPAILSGANIIVVGAQYQKSPFAIMSLKSNPIPTPQAMKGKKIGVQPTNEAIWNAYLSAAGIDPSTVTKVSVGFDTSELVAGAVDGWFSFITNEPNELKAKGIETVTFLLAETGLPLVSQHYIVNKKALADNRPRIKAALLAEVKGWRDSLKTPATGAHLAATKYGVDLKLDEAEQTNESIDQNKLILTDDTKANGIFTITDAHVTETLASLAKAGTVITKDKLFDLSLINEIYTEHPELKTPPS
jgi:ABC-type nitrate/sulfonate/bicarbonate transport system substrate-binding protein